MPTPSPERRTPDTLSDIHMDEGTAARILVRVMYGPGTPDSWQLTNAHLAIAALRSQSQKGLAS
jgi:hypothetical protein